MTDELEQQINKILISLGGSYGGINDFDEDYVYEAKQAIQALIVQEKRNTVERIAYHYNNNGNDFVEAATSVMLELQEKNK
jgi:hypothetical protein